MSRRTRNWLDRSCYHLTHRCLNKEYFFENPITRQTYLKELREMISRFHVDVLNYIITCNHIHLLVYAGKGVEIANGMRYLQGRMGQRYNMFTGRQGAFWSDRYHATLIESGDHLSRCLFYIDFNMVRTGVVSHPSEWKHSGYHELTGTKNRNKIINFTKLLRHLGMLNNKERFFDWYNRTIETEAINHMKRQRFWSEALAVGSEAWINRIKGKIGKKRMLIVDTRGEKVKVPVSYTQKSEVDVSSLREEESSFAIF